MLLISVAMAAPVSDVYWKAYSASEGRAAEYSKSTGACEREWHGYSYSAPCSVNPVIVAGYVGLFPVGDADFMRGGSSAISVSSLHDIPPPNGFYFGMTMTASREEILLDCDPNSCSVLRKEALTGEAYARHYAKQTALFSVFATRDPQAYGLLFGHAPRNADPPIMARIDDVKCDAPQMDARAFAPMSRCIVRVGFSGFTLDEQLLNQKLFAMYSWGREYAIKRVARIEMSCPTSPHVPTWGWASVWCSYNVVSVEPV